MPIRFTNQDRLLLVIFNLFQCLQEKTRKEVVFHSLFGCGPIFGVQFYKDCLCNLYFCLSLFFWALHFLWYAEQVSIFFKFWISIEFLSIIYKIFICYRLFLPYEVATLVYIDSLISTISASINFVIFYFFNESFRKELMKIVGKPSLISSQVSYSGYQRQSQGLAENTKSIYTVLWLQRWETLSSYTSPCQSQNHSVGCQCVCLVHGLQTWSNNTWEKPTCFKSDLCILSFNCFLWFIGSEILIIWQQIQIYSGVPNKQISLLCK